MPASPAKTTAARKAAKSRSAKAAAPPADAKADGKGKGEALLRAGLKALGEARERQTRVVETLLGIPSGGKLPAAKKTALDSLGDSLGFRKLEDVFDQRIAAALERLGIPSAEEFAALREEVVQLRAVRAAPNAPSAPAAPASRRKR